MEDYSLHILDLIQNSINARATQIQIQINESTFDDKVKIMIIDNGFGMTKEEIVQCTSPFYTKRNSRKVGLGIPLFIQSCEQANGLVTIESSYDKGTTIIGEYDKFHINALPLGDIEETIYLAMSYSEQILIVFEYQMDEMLFQVSNHQLGDLFVDTPITNYQVMIAIKEYIKSNINEIRRPFYENIRRFKENAR